MEREFHKLILSINKAKTGLASVLDEDQIQELMKSISDIKDQFTLSQKNELILIDISLLENSINTIKIILANYDDKINNKDDRNGSRNYIRHNEVRAAIDDFIEFIHDPLLKLSNKPFALLSSPAGVGKSHLLADIAFNRMNINKSCILLLGQHFTTDEPPWAQILRNSLRLSCNEKQLLGALNAKAEAQGERLLFFIDAINEGRGRYFWKDHICGFVSEFKNYPWIGLVLSIRSSYEEVLILEEIISNGKITLLKHEGFMSIEYKAMSVFF